MLVIAHRGASGTQPENTLVSFRKAIELGAEMIELDDHLCKTGELVVIHDYSVNRTTNGNGFVSHKTLNELQSLDAGNGEKIPTLHEIFELVSGKAKINIELKGKHVATETATLIMAAIQEKKWKAEDFVISSFHHRQLSEFHALIPDVPIGILYKRHPNGYQKLAHKLNASSINLSINHVNANLVEEIHQNGLQVWIYTVNSEEEFEKVKAMSVDAIFTNFPERFIS
ncbi:MAG: glycerophosphodiester phosphodiesterase [Bacteroidales bacterium]|nr:glycerophosphodiester phosphodiesterase [Bacteroidales bacterium]